MPQKEKTDWGGLAVAGLGIATGVLLLKGRLPGQPPPPPPPPPPPGGVLYLENLQVSPSTPLVGSQVSITAIGTTDVTGTYPVTLRINGVPVQTTNVSIIAGDAKPVSFTYTPTSTGLYAVALDGLNGQFQTVSGIICYNDGLTFATQAELDFHVTTVHPSWPTAPCLIDVIRWGSNSLTRVGQKLVGRQGSMWLYVLDNKQAPQPYGPLSVTFQTFNLWYWFVPSDEPQISVTPNIFIGKFGDIGERPFNPFVGSAGAPWLMLTSGGTVPGRTGDSGKTFTMTVPSYADLEANMPPGLYDVMVMVRMRGSLVVSPFLEELNTYFYVIKDAWKVP